MPAVAGSIESVTLDGRYYAVAADADTTLFLGGDTNEVESNGDGSARVVKTRMPWKLGGVPLEIDDSNDDEEFIQDLMNRGENFPITMTKASGETFQGTGQITGDAETSSQSQTKTVDMSGPGRLTRQ